MHVLLVVATPPEAQLLQQQVPFTQQSGYPFTVFQAEGKQGVTFSLLHSGLGMVHTGLALGHFFALNQPDAALQFGVAGSVSRSLALGSVVEVVRDTFSELGAEDHDAFLTPDEMGLNTPVTYPATPGTFPWPGSLTFPQVPGITVNTVHGNATSVQQVQQRYPDAIETMEGAAFFQACARYAIPCRAFRGISNYVEPRNRPAWKLREAATSVQQAILHAFF